MPIGFDTDETVPVVLAACRGKPKPPTFNCRHLSIRQWNACNRIRAEALRETDDDKSLALLLKMFGIAIAGWANIDQSFTPESLADYVLDHLTINQAWELSAECLNAPMVAEADRKKSESQSPSDTAISAAAAEAPVTSPPAI